jgi:hypothetical protein
MAGETAMANRNTMTGKTQPDRWEATWLAVAMAIAGAPFLFDKLGSLLQTSLLSISAVQHSGPVMLASVGAILLLAEQDGGTIDSPRTQKEGGRQ